MASAAPACEGAFCEGGFCDGASCDGVSCARAAPPHRLAAMAATMVVLLRMARLLTFERYHARAGSSYRWRAGSGIRIPRVVQPLFQDRHGVSGTVVSGALPAAHAKILSTTS